MIISINGAPCQCEKGEFLLEVARRHQIMIPTLCHHEALRGQGACRLCIVEVWERGRQRLVVSCVFPVENEMEVFTNSEAVAVQRGMTLAFLRKRAPQSERIAALCRMYKAPELDRLAAAPSGKCILCGLCVRACRELGAGAIATINRGVTKEIATPYHAPSPACVGCGACARLCPTGAIELQENADSRQIWGKSFALVRCPSCGVVVGTAEEMALAACKAGRENENLPGALCAACRQDRMARTLAHAFGVACP